MPLYEYRCTACGHIFEKIQSFSAPDEKECPKCGAPVERLLSAPAIQFKGSGFYLTDYGKAGSSKSGASEPSSSSKNESSPSTPSSGSGDSGSSKPSSSAPASGNTSSSGGSSSGSSGTSSSTK